MPIVVQPRVFLSYTRCDLNAALEVRDRIEAELGAGTVWHDVRNLAGDHWWTEIEDAIRGKAAVEHVILLCSAEALARNVVRREWRLAWREGKVLTNVFWSARPGFNPPAFGTLPDWIKAKSMIDLSLPDRWQSLFDVLKEAGRRTSRPFMIPAMPEGFVERPEEFGKLRAALLNADGEAVAITAALRGAGGFGKTILAQALALNDEIQDAFYDGILWVTLGERPNIVETLADLLKTLTGREHGFSQIVALTNLLKEQLEFRKCLLVVDDVWSESHLRPFLDGAPLTARLITTRRDDILPAGTVRVHVDSMKEAEAVELLSQGLGTIGPIEAALLRRLARERLGEWPVVIRLVNRFMRREVERGSTPLEAIEHANGRLDKKKLTYFDRNDEKARDAAVESTVRASIEYLVEEVGRNRNPTVYNSRRYEELAVFAEDVDVPVATIVRLWRTVADADEVESRDLLKDLYNLALLQALDLKLGTVRLHDVMRKYLTQQLGTRTLRRLHQQIIQAYKDENGSGIIDTAERRYFYTWFATHLAEAGDRKALHGLLVDPNWMQRKLHETGPLPLISDYQKLGDRHVHQLIGGALQLASGSFLRASGQLALQLIGRLTANMAPELAEFLVEARQLFSGPTLVPKHASFTRPDGPELIRIEGPGGKVLAVLRDGCLACASVHNSIHVFDISDWRELVRQEGLEGNATALLQLSDGRIAAASDNGTIELFDSIGGGVTARIKGHRGGITALVELPDGRLASSSRDKTIRVWELPSLKEVARLKGHQGIVYALAVLADGRIASGGDDNTVRLWQPASAREVGRLKGHLHGVRALATLSDGRLASGSLDRTVRIWNVVTAQQTTLLEGHSDGVWALAMLPDNCLASGSHDETICLWDVEKGRKKASLKGHRFDVTALAALPDGRLASASHNDETLRVWDVRLPPGIKTSSGSNAEHAGHDRQVTAIVVLQDGRIATASKDNTVRLWDAITGLELARLEGHGNTVWTLAVLPDGLLASGSDDGTVRLWNTLKGSEVLRVKHFGERVSALAVLRDGRMAVGCNGGDILLVDIARRHATGRLVGHKADVWQFVALPNGKLASASIDGTVRTWDTHTCRELLCFEGHTGAVTALAALEDGNVVSASDDDTVQLWNLATGKVLARAINDFAFTPALAAFSNGDVALASGDATVRVWRPRAASGQTSRNPYAATLCGDVGFHAIALLPNSKTLIAGDDLGRLHWLEFVNAPPGP